MAEEQNFIPNLFVLGAMKAGTSAMYTYLDQAEDICMSKPKEPFYFECEYAQGLDFYRNKYFPHWSGELYIGEARHRNLYLPFIPERIYKVNRNAKFIIILREPVQRAISHWWHWYSRRIIKEDFQTYIYNDLDRIKAGATYVNGRKYCKDMDRNGMTRRSTVIDSGYYYDQINRYYKLFPRNNIKLILSEELNCHTKDVLHNVFNWLDISCDRYLLGVLDQVNKSQSVVLNKTSKQMLRNIPFKKFLSSTARAFVYKKYREWLSPKAEIHRDLLEFLYDHYKPYNERLSEMIDIGTWFDKKTIYNTSNKFIKII